MGDVVQALASCKNLHIAHCLSRRADRRKEQQVTAGYSLRDGIPSVHMFQGLCWCRSLVASTVIALSLGSEILHLGGVSALWNSSANECLSDSFFTAQLSRAIFLLRVSSLPECPQTVQAVPLVITDLCHLRIHSGPGVQGTAAVTQTCTPNQVGIPANN